MCHIGNLGWGTAGWKNKLRRKSVKVVQEIWKLQENRTGQAKSGANTEKGAWADEVRV